MSGIVYPFGFGTVDSGPTPPPASNLLMDMDPDGYCYDSIQETTLCVDGEEVEAFVNKITTSPQISFWQEGVNKKPVWYEEDSAQNDKPYVEFDGSNDVLVTNQGSLLLRQNSMSFYIVMRPEDQQSTQYATVFNKSTNSDWTDGWRLGMPDPVGFPNYETMVGTSDFNYDYTNTITIDGQQAGWFTQAEVYTLRFASGSGVSPYVNTASNTWSTGYTDTGNTNLFASRSTPASPVVMGGSRGLPNDPSTPTFFFAGRVYRILVYGVCHTDAEHTAIINNLKSTYDIS